MLNYKTAQCLTYFKDRHGISFLWWLLYKVAELKRLKTKNNNEYDRIL